MTIRAAILGTGLWARAAHVPALRGIDDLELIACVGRTMESTDRFAATERIPHAFDSLERLLESAECPDLLVVAGPDDIHPAAATAALRAGVAVFCEKPLANTASMAEDLASLAQLTGIPATVGYSFRYGPAVQALKKDVASGRLGQIWFLELFEYNSQFHPRLGKPMNWKGDPAHAAAGALYEYGSHVVDLAGWIAGPIHEVSTSLTRVLPGARLDDVATIQMRLTGPAIGMLVCGWVLSGSVPGIRVRVHGSEGLGEVEMSQTVIGHQVYRRYDLDGSVREDVELEPLGDPGSAYALRHLTDFVAKVRADRPTHEGTLPTFADGARVQRVLEAALGATQHWAAVGVGEAELGNQKG
jgi:predicted dehydrogenase